MHLSYVICVTTAFVLFLSGGVDANCKAHDAKWKKKNRGPLVTQPSRTDPTKIKLDWASILENARCVDEWNVYAWKDGQTKANASVINIKNKAAVSYIVTVDPCVGYSFAIEYLERDLMGTDKGTSGTATFKSEAVPQVINQNKDNFAVGYHWDRIKKVYDLSKVSIIFPTRILRNPSCVKYVEVVGVELPKKTIALNSRERAPTPGGSGSYPGYNHNHGHGGQGFYPGGNSGVGGHSVYPGGNSHIYPPSSSSSGGNYLYPPTTTTRRPRWKRRAAWGRTTRRPSYGQTTRRPGGSSSYPGSGARISGRVTPPFLKDQIEVTANIKACYPYRLTLKIVTPQGSTMMEVNNLALPQLAEMSTYKPPPLAKLFRVTPALSATSPPVIAVQPNYGVPASCIADFFQAVDLHMGRLESEIGYHSRQELQSKAHGDKLREQLKEEKTSQLRRFGCVCDNTLIKVNTTTAKVFKKMKGVFGVFKYDGMQNGKPYYKRQDSDWYLINKPTTSRPPYSNQRRTKRFIGRVDETTSRPLSYSQAAGGRSSSVSSSSSYSSSSSGGAGGWAQPQPSLSSNYQAREAAPKEKIYYLYWYAKDKVWAVGEKMDGKKIQLRTKKNNTAKCPADPLTNNKWQYTGTISWHSETSIHASCGILH